MALPIKNEESARSAEVENKPGNYLEGLIGATIIAKLKTRSGSQFQRISERDVVNVIQAFRSNQINVTNSGRFEIIKLDIAGEQRITLSLVRGSIRSLLAMKPDLAGDRIKFACGHVNSPSVEKKLLNLKEDIQMQSSGVLSGISAADLVLETKAILFA